MVGMQSDKATEEKIVAVRRWTDKLLTFKTTRPVGYQFTPGQFARIGLLIHGEMVWRAYSIISAEEDDFLEYYAIIVTDGLFTSCLNTIKQGDTLWIEKQCYGFMTVDRFSDGNDLWMLSTGTGIGPFLSILQQREVWHQFQNLILVHGTRHEDELVFQARLDELRSQAEARDFPAKLHLIYTVTREQVIDSSKYLSGRITTLLQNGSLEKDAGLSISSEDSRLMICGNPEMITEVRALLRQRGLGPCRRNAGGQFVTEDYW